MKTELFELDAFYLQTGLLTRLLFLFQSPITLIYTLMLESPQRICCFQKINQSLKTPAILKNSINSQIHNNCFTKNNQSMQSTFESRQQFYQQLLKFPPFFTLQEHEETRRKQILYWGEILINYFKRNKMVNSSVSQIVGIPIIQDRSTAVPKKLSRQQVIAILQGLSTLGSIQFKQGTEAVLILHFSAFQLADEIYKWAKQNFLINDVQTLNYITNGKNTKKVLQSAQIGDIKSYICFIETREGIVDRYGRVIQCQISMMNVEYQAHQSSIYHVNGDGQPLQTFQSLYLP